jgi:hypothetical protein
MVRRSTLLFAGLLVLALLGSGLAQIAEDSVPVTLGAQPDAVIQELAPLDPAGTSGSTEVPTSSDPSVGAATSAPQDEVYYTVGTPDGTDNTADQAPEYTSGPTEEQPTTTEVPPDPVSYTKDDSEDKTAPVDTVHDGRMYKYTSGQEPQQPQRRHDKPRAHKPTSMPGHKVIKRYTHDQQQLPTGNQLPSGQFKPMKLRKGVQLPSDLFNTRTRYEPTDGSDPTNTDPEQDGPDSAGPYGTTQDDPAPEDPATDGPKYKHTGKTQQPRVTRRGPAQPAHTKPAARKGPSKQHQKPSAGYQQQPEDPQEPEDSTEEPQQVPYGSHTTKGGKGKSPTYTPGKLKDNKHSKDQTLTPSGRHPTQPLPGQAQVDQASQTVPMVPAQPTTEGPAAGDLKVPKPTSKTGKRK